MLLFFDAYPFSGLVSTIHYAMVDNFNQLIQHYYRLMDNQPYQINKMLSGQFQQENQLGGGSFGKVFKVVQNGKIYAVKRIDRKMNIRSQRQKQLRREIEVMKSIKHENIVRFYNFKDDKQKKYYQIYMQYCKGTNLRKFLLQPKYYRALVPASRRKYFSVKVFLDYINALTQIRSKMITNRDIKPDNIMINWTKQGKVSAKMIDLGQARFTTSLASTLLVGTPQYMAPEIKLKRQSYSQKCDLWSLGQTTYQIFQGLDLQFQNQPNLRCPFKQNFFPKKQKDFDEYYNVIIHQSISLDIQRTPGPFRQIIRELCRVRPEQRIQVINILKILIQRFQQYSDCFDADQQKYQKQRLCQCMIKEKETSYRKNQIKQIKQKIKQLYQLLYLNLIENLPQSQYGKYLQVLKIIVMIIQKIHLSIKKIIRTMDVFQSKISDIQMNNMKSSSKSNSKSAENKSISEQDYEFIVSQMLNQIFPQHKFKQLQQHKQMLMRFLNPKLKTLDFQFSGLNQELFRFILSKFQEEKCKIIIKAFQNFNIQ